MTIQTFPSLVGLAWPVKKSPTWATVTQKSISGKETRLQLWTFPRYKIELNFDYLGSAGANTDWQTLVGFFNKVGGAATPFHFADAVDNAVANQSLGTGDGTTTQFNFIRPLGGFVEPVQDVTQASVAVKVNGSPTSAYTFVTDPNWGFTYALNFNSAPAVSAAITASFSYNWACRFDDDTAAFSNLMSNFWELQKLPMTTIKVV